MAITTGEKSVRGDMKGLHPIGSVLAAPNRSMRPVLAVTLLACAAGTGADDDASSPLRHLSVAVTDTLISSPGYAVAQPLSVSRDAVGRYIVTDASDKVLRVFASDGTQHSTVGRPGTGPGEFAVLVGGGVFGDSIFGYDLRGTRLSLFDSGGVFVRSVQIFEPGQPMPRQVTALDDSLFLVVGFPAGSHTRDLLRVVRPDGSVVSTFFNMKEYFTPENPDLIQSSIVYADGASGAVFVTVMGHDSIYAFDYSGVRLGAGAVTRAHGPIADTFRTIIDANQGRRVRPDGSLVIEGQTAIVAVVALDNRQALVQSMALDYGANGRLDRASGGTFALATVDPARGHVALSGHVDQIGALVGRERSAGGLLARYVEPEYERIAIVLLTPEG